MSALYTAKMRRDARNFLSLATLSVLAFSPLALGAETVPATRSRVIPYGTEDLVRVPAEPEVLRAPPLEQASAHGIAVLRAGAPTRTGLRRDEAQRETKPPLIFRPPASGASEQNGRVISAPVVVRAVDPQPMPVGPLARRDNAAADISYLGVEQGLSNSYPQAIAQGPDGSLWIAIWDGGLSRYDGQSLTTFTKDNGLSSDRLHAVVVDPEGALWIASAEAGIMRYDGESFTYFGTDQGLVHDWVDKMVQDRHGNLWIATSGGVSRFDGQAFTNFGTEQGLDDEAVTAVLEDRSGAIWVGTEGGAYRLDGDRFVPVRFPGLAVEALACDLEGNLWMGTRSGLTRWDGSSFLTWTVDDGLLADRLLAITTTRDGDLWLSSVHGATRVIIGGKDAAGSPTLDLLHYTDEHGLSHRRVYDIFEDTAGTMWLATLGGGVSRIRPNSFVHLTEKEGLSDQRVWDIEEDTSGDIWFATDHGASRLRGGRFAHLAIHPEVSNDQIHSIHEEAPGILWFGSNRSTITRWDGKSFTRYDGEDGVPGRRIFAFLSDDRGLWVGGSAGLVRLQGSTMIRYEVEGLDQNGVKDIVADRGGALWLGLEGSDGGLARLTESTLEVWKEESGLGASSVIDVMIDSYQRTWVATKRGIAVLAGDTFIRFGQGDGLSSDLVWTLTEGPGGEVWAATEKGLNRIVLPVGSTSPSITTFRLEDGLKALDFNMKSNLVDSSQRAWWGTGKALSMLDLSDRPFNRDAADAPGIRLTSLDLNQQPVSFRELTDGRIPGLEGVAFTSVAPFANIPVELELPHDIHALTFHYAATDITAPHRLSYQTMLGGADKTWNPATEDTREIHRNLRPGNYLFRVRARRDSAPWGAAAELRFIVHPPWWQESWARLLWAALAFGGLTFLHRLRLVALRRRQRHLEELVVERTTRISSQNRQIEAQAEELRSANQQLTHLARTDPLTGLWNRRAFLEAVATAKAAFDRHGTPFCLVLGDVDHFKQFNDRFGHACGDFILQRIAKVMTATSRLDDTVARWGGEEFIALLPQTSSSGGRAYAEKIRSTIRKGRHEFEGQELSVRISSGVVEIQKGWSVDDCIAHADEALYAAKEAGRDRVVVYGAATSSPS